MPWPLLNAHVEERLKVVVVLHPCWFLRDDDENVDLKTGS